MSHIRFALVFATVSALSTQAADTVGGRSALPADPFAWPAPSQTARPWAYWWWMGSAVDRENLTRELTRYRDAGMGGVHIVPIYGAKGWEDRSIEYLSPRWLEMLRHAITEASRLGLGVDMTTGSGWCFGGPHVTDDEANALAVAQTFDVAAGAALARKFSPRPQALMAFGPAGRKTDLLPLLASDGAVGWRAEDGPWRVYAVTQKPSGQRVKRAGPGGTGWMLNLLHPPAMTHYLRGFEEALAAHPGPLPRAQYHDSYEYRSDWAPGILAQFEQSRGYRLQEHLDALFGRPAQDPERVARVKGDYRETMSDVIIEESLAQWAAWARGRGMLTRNQAHGSPGNLLDLYALADIPETEMFNKDRNPLIAKFASSAAHVAGRPLVSAETGTWLREHFTETLADLKFLLDDLFVSGVNHIFYHGTCYSPDEAAWPGWLFYASTQMNPRHSIWRDAPALNAYATRCQSVLQAGGSDNDILLYWPLHDFWHRDGALEQKLTVHKLEWFEPEGIGRMASLLWKRGYAFDYVSDRQLAGARVAQERVVVAGGEYRVVVVPACQRMPVATLRQLLALAAAGATVVFEKELPRDVPGWGKLEQRRAELRRLVDSLALAKVGAGLQRATIGRGTLLTGEIESALEFAGASRESLVNQAGLLFVRRRAGDSRTYFLANRGTQTIDGWLPLATAAAAVVAMDPMTGRTGVAPSRRPTPGRTEVRLRLEPGHSVILHASPRANLRGPAWTRDEPAGSPVSLVGGWSVQFIAGGPELPPPIATRELASWTELGGEAARRFAGTAVYSLSFDAPMATGRSSRWLLDLGQVSQSARVRLNGEELGTVFIPPFQVALPALKPTGNLLEVEVTNVAANRIRDLDRRQVAWRVFHDINLVNLDYKPFDASAWPIHESGLLGPVTLTPAADGSAR